MRDRRIGFHVSIAGGLVRAVTRAVRIGCTTLQIFCGNPRGWRVTDRSEEESVAFRSERRGAGLEPLFVHSCYLINPCATDERVFKKSVQRLAYELRISSLLGAAYVLHPGTSKGRPPGWRIRRAADAIREALERAACRPPIVLENTASAHGPGGDFKRLSQLAAALDESVHGHQVGICVDSCHAFACGYDLRSPAEVERMASDMDATVGLARLRLLHVNDARDECGSGRDRHQHIGEGTIGRRGVRNFLMHPALCALPIILETPWVSPERDRRNLNVVRELLEDQGGTVSSD